MPVIASAFTWFEHFLPFVEEKYVHVATGVFVLFLLTVIGVLYKKSLRSIEENLIPDDSISLKNIIQVVVEGLYNIVSGVVSNHPEKHFPLLGAIFIYILLSNLLGLVPGFLPPTEAMETNFAVAITVFLYFNYQGIKTQGWKHYLGHLCGPVPALALLIFPLELLGLFIRPGSLSLRLFGNINGDHILMSTIQDMFTPILPIPFMAFGILVCLIQAFVFTLLSSVYVGMATEAEEH